MYARIIVIFAVIALIAFILAVVGLATSGDDDDGNSDVSDSIDGPLVSCTALDELDSYRYTVSVHIADAATPTEAPEESVTPAPLDALSEALANLLSDFGLDGAYVRPDRSQAVLSFGEDEIELRQIGDQSWVRVGDEWSEEDASTDELLTPVLVCNDVIQAVSPSLKLADPADEDIEDVGTNHYVLDPEKTQNLPPLLGQELEGAYAIDLWVAKDTRYPARLLIESDDPNSEEPAFDLAMDVFDAGDNSVSVDVPETDSP